MIKFPYIIEAGTDSQANKQNGQLINLAKNFTTLSVDSNDFSCKYSGKYLSGFSMTNDI